ncbi:hypothetical protein HpDR47_05590 [Helicobacter pylori]
MLCLERCYGDCWDNLCRNRNLFVFFYNLVKLVEKLSKKQPKAATTVNNETQKSQAASVTNEPTEAKETKD